MEAEGFAGRGRFCYGGLVYSEGDGHCEQTLIDVLVTFLAGEFIFYQCHLIVCKHLPGKDKELMIRIRDIGLRASPQTVGSYSIQSSDPPLSPLRHRNPTTEDAKSPPNFTAERAPF